MPTLEDAIILSATKHAGQPNKDGKPYILHPLRVMLAMDTDEERIAAVLHDVVEDSDVTLDALRTLGYSDAVVDAIDSVTKRPEEENDYEAFIRRAKSGSALARKV